MSAPHVIRLRGPWEYQPLARSVLLPDGSTQTEPGDLPPGGRLQMPADWGATLGPDFRGRVRYTRGFNWTAGLDPGDRVELVLEQADAFAEVALNGTLLGRMQIGDPATRFEIAALLQPRNELVVIVELPHLTPTSPPLPRRGRDSLPGGLIGEVRLEIHALDEVAEF